MNFPLNLAVNGTASLSQVGNYVYYSTGSAGGADQSIKVKTDAGDEYILKPGQGFRLDGRNFNNLIFSNNANAANILGTMLIADGGFFDNRVTGSVEVIDGGKARTLGGGAFMGGVQCVATAAQNSIVQLWNPVGSGKNVILESITYSSTNNGGILFRVYNAALSNLLANGVSKLAGGAAVSVGQLRYAPNPGVLGGNNMLILGIAAAQFSTYQFKEPVVLPPGQGMLVTQGTQNVDVTGNFEWYEESNA
ncbi:hypothetical protein [Herbaspirillum huttiense]|uniref:hypothetical protein n=1 Tax=Herbaspirillum huttiense TaxID=863372 RepID=UPI003F3B01D7